MKHLIWVATITIISYLVAAFIFWEINPALWTKEGRGAVVVVSVLVSLYFVTMDYKVHNNHNDQDPPALPMGRMKAQGK